MLEREQTLQENSEKRWAQHIDHARSEAHNLRKKYEKKVSAQANQIETLQNSLLKSQERIATAQASLNHKNDTIEALKKQVSELQVQHSTIISELTVMQAERKRASNKRTAAKKSAISV